ncbi:hypothetical protein DM01DRAFT_1364917 [Hesseltinella vesiculosa]|uniref:Uncharacterized protein n=1 Tax=Hesseltinella vesiculosa TaxID=101127 RepID=A0A1X2G2Y0_9FUNG|nr:hypothetical protein DM01DRAFT_1364917 [Hesseltinella vesiculosa]
MGTLLYIAMACYQPTAWKLFPLGYFVVFLFALVSNMLASNKTLHSASLGASIWAIILGCCLRMVVTRLQPNDKQELPPWLKIAQQTELYISISLVLLCIDISVLRPLAPRALFVSWLDTPTLFMIVAYIGWHYMGIDKQLAIILSGATFICGSSAAIALGASMGASFKTKMPIAIISIFTIPSIIALPYIAKRLGLSPEVSGAWFGGCVDSTGAVIASASIYGDNQAVSTAAVVKMMQNVLIGPLSVIVAWAWSEYELRTLKTQDDEETHLQQPDTASETTSASNTTNDAFVLEPIPKPAPESSATYTSNKDAVTLTKTPKKRDTPLVLLWRRFPKFVLGFIITAVLFNTVLTVETERTSVYNFSFYVSEYFSTLSFVSIGLGLQLGEIKKDLRSLGKLCTLYLMAQLVDIVVTALLAWVAFTKF